MGIENPIHLLFIAAIALVFLGPKRLPELARAAGRMMGEFRAALNGEDQVEDAVAVEDPVYAPVAANAAAPPADPARPPALAAPPADPARPPALGADDPARSVGSADAPDRRPL